MPERSPGEAPHDAREDDLRSPPFARSSDCQSRSKPSLPRAISQRSRDCYADAPHKSSDESQLRCCWRGLRRCATWQWYPKRKKVRSA